MFDLNKKFKIKRRFIAILASLHFYGNPSKKLKIIGVTGTNGKTTTATLLYRVVTALGYKVGLIGTVENIINGEKIPLPENIPQTTPDPIYLNTLLNEMVKRGCEYVFMEVSSHSLDQKRVAGINFSGGIFSNLTHDHLDYHKNIENYFKAKKKFFKMLPKNAFALSNADDTYGEEILKDIKAKKYLYSFIDKAINSKLHGLSGTFNGKINKMDSSGLTLNFNSEKIETKLLGRFNAYNLLAVWSTLKLLGFDMKKVNKILENIEPPSGRFDCLTSKNGFLIVIDYAHTPDALEKILTTIKEIRPMGGKIISVFGCGGDRDPLKRPIMGKIGTTLSDKVILTSDNPRSENPEVIIEAMKTNLSTEDLLKVSQNIDRHEAIKEAVRLANKNDIILCAGKGHEQYQEIMGIKHYFNDMVEFKKYI